MEFRSADCQDGVLSAVGADAHLGDAPEAVVAALVAAPVADVPVEVPHLDCGVPEGRHGDVRARKHLPRHLVVRALQHRPQLCMLRILATPKAHP